MRSAFVDIVRARGFRGLYAGLSPTLVEIIPYAGLQFGTYDTFKRWTMVRLGSCFYIDFWLRVWLYVSILASQILSNV